MDVYIEQLVNKRSSGIDVAKKLGIFLLAFVLVVAGFLLFGNKYVGPFALFIIAGAIYGAWFLMSSLNVEYEYIVTNDEIDIDKIVARRKRKRILTVKISNFDSFGKYKQAEHVQKQYQTKIDASALINDEDTYYASFHHQQKGNCLLTFTPGDKVLSIIEPIYKRKAMFNR